MFGDALANVLDHAGFAVTREYYVNDGGAQIETLARSLHLRYREALGEAIGDDPGRPLSRRLPGAGGGRDRRAATATAGSAGGEADWLRAVRAASASTRCWR